MATTESKKLICCLIIVCLGAMEVAWFISEHDSTYIIPRACVLSENTRTSIPVSNFNDDNTKAAQGNVGFFQLDKHSKGTYSVTTVISNVTTGILSNQSSNHPNASREILWGCYDYRSNRLGASRSPAKQETLDRLGCKKRPPDAILIGVKKCGTQTLTGFLDLHPQVVSDVYPFDSHRQAVIDGDIIDFNKNVPLSTPLEVSFIDIVDIQRYPQSLASMSPNVTGFSRTKFFLLLTDPVRRAQSDYVHVKVKIKHLRNDPEPVKHTKMPVWDKKLRQRREPNILFKGYRIANTFEKSVLNATGAIDVENQLIRKGVYIEYVEEILKYIPRDNLFVLDGETFALEPWTVLSEVEKVLGVHSFFSKNLFQKKGSFYCPVLSERPDADCLKGKGRKKGNIDSTIKRRLSEFYRRHNVRLRTFLGQDFRWK